MNFKLTIDLKTILTLMFSLSIVILTFTGALPVKDAVLPLGMMVMWYYFNKTNTIQTENTSTSKVL